MAPYGVSVTKEITFRGVPERFSNVYHYDITAPIEADYVSLANAVVAKDKEAYQGSVAYKEVRVFGPTNGSAADNLMRYIGDLTGGGTRSPAGPGLYVELCAVPSIYVGRSPGTNRKVFVRKYIHILTFQNSGSTPSDALLATAEQTFWSAWLNSAKVLTSGPANYPLCTPKGVSANVGANASTLKYARVRQLKQ